MSTRSSLVILGVAGLLLTVLPALAKIPSKAKPKAAPVQSAIIENTGSTNTFGYTFQVSSDGTVIMISMGGHVSRSDESSAEPTRERVEPLAVQDVNKFFQDLNAAMPLTSLPVRRGMRSMSFGTQTFITYKGQKSPDLTFASDPRSIALKADIDAITKALHIGNAPKRPIVLQQTTPPANEPTF